MLTNFIKSEILPLFTKGDKSSQKVVPLNQDSKVAVIDFAGFLSQSEQLINDVNPTKSFSLKNELSNHIPNEILHSEISPNETLNVDVEVLGAGFKLYQPLNSDDAQNGKLSQNSQDNITNSQINSNTDLNSLYSAKDILTVNSSESKDTLAVDKTIDYKSEANAISSEKHKNLSVKNDFITNINEVKSADTKDIIPEITNKTNINNINSEKSFSNSISSNLIAENPETQNTDIEKNSESKTKLTEKSQENLLKPNNEIRPIKNDEIDFKVEDKPNIIISKNSIISNNIVAESIVNNPINIIDKPNDLATLKSEKETTLSTKEGFINKPVISENPQVANSELVKDSSKLAQEKLEFIPEVKHQKQENSTLETVSSKTITNEKLGDLKSNVAQSISNIVSNDDSEIRALKDFVAVDNKPSQKSEINSNKIESIQKDDVSFVKVVQSISPKSELISEKLTDIKIDPKSINSEISANETIKKVEIVANEKSVVAKEDVKQVFIKSEKADLPSIEKLNEFKSKVELKYGIEPTKSNIESKSSAEINPKSNIVVPAISVKDEFKQILVNSETEPKNVTTKNDVNSIKVDSKAITQDVKITPKVEIENSVPIKIVQNISDNETAKDKKAINKNVPFDLSTLKNQNVKLEKSDSKVVKANDLKPTDNTQAKADLNIFKENLNKPIEVANNKVVIAKPIVEKSPDFTSNEITISKKDYKNIASIIKSEVNAKNDTSPKFEDNIIKSDNSKLDKIAESINKIETKVNSNENLNIVAKTVINDFKNIDNADLSLKSQNDSDTKEVKNKIENDDRIIKTSVNLQSQEKSDSQFYSKTNEIDNSKITVNAQNNTNDDFSRNGSKKDNQGSENFQAKVNLQSQEKSDSQSYSTINEIDNSKIAVNAQNNTNDDFSRNGSKKDNQGGENSPTKNILNTSPEQNTGDEATKKASANFVRTLENIQPRQTNSIVHQANKPEVPTFMAFSRVRPSNIPNIISDIVGNTSGNYIGTAKLTLTPKSLGTIFVEINVSNESVKLNIKADNRDTVKAIESTLNSLRDKIESQGMKIENVNINYYQGEQKKDASANRERNNDGRKNKADLFDLDKILAQPEIVDKPISKKAHYQQGNYIEKYI